MTIDGAGEDILASARTRLKFEGSLTELPRCCVAPRCRAAGREMLHGARTDTEYYLKALLKRADRSSGMCSRFEAAAHFSTSAGARAVRTIKSADLFDVRVHIYMKH